MHLNLGRVTLDVDMTRGHGLGMPMAGDPGRSRHAAGPIIIIATSGRAEASSQSLAPSMASAS
jgi:hypothetical protein